MSNGATTATTRPDRVIFPKQAAHIPANFLLIVGGICLLITAIGAYQQPAQFAHSWLFSYLYFFTLVLGCLFWTMVHHATNAGWSTLIRRQMENVAGLFPVLLGLFIPLLLCGPTLYGWMQPDAATHDHALHEKALYLNLPFYYLRVIFYFAVFIGLALYYRHHSVQQDSDGCAVHSIRLRAPSYVLAMVLGMAVIFSAFDWVMSLDYHWYSTMFSVTIFAGSGLSGMALIILIVLALQRGGYLGAVGAEHYQLMGKVLFSFTLFWAWVSIAQYLLIWYANIPEETIFFVKRNEGSWLIISLLIITFKFAIPFLGLLFQAAKRNPAWLGKMAGAVLLGQAIDLYWHVLPQIHPTGWAPHWLDIVIWVGMGLILTSFFLRKLSSAAVYPVRDPRLRESVECYN